MTAFTTTPEAVSVLHILDFWCLEEYPPTSNFEKPTLSSFSGSRYLTPYKYVYVYIDLDERLGLIFKPSVKLPFVIDPFRSERTQKSTTKP